MILEPMTLQAKWPITDAATDEEAADCMLAPAVLFGSPCS